MVSADVIFATLFSAAVLFLATAGLQLVFGVQRIVNLAVGSIYAFGAYVGLSMFAWFVQRGGPPILLLPVLLLAGVLAGQIGFVMERILRLVYARDEAFQLLMTFSFVLMFQDLFRYIWGAQPLIMSDLPSVYGHVTLGTLSFPIYNAAVIVCALVIALALWWFIERTSIGHIVRATAENRVMTEALGVNTKRVSMFIFLLGSILGTVGGALVIPTTAASLDMPLALIIDAFAVVVIGGLGSMRGALIGALIVSFMRASALIYFPEIEIMAIYIVVVMILAVRPFGLFGKVAP